MILPGHEKPRNCMYPDEMKRRWYLSTQESPEYVLLVADYPSVTPVSPSTTSRSLTMYLEAVIKRVERCTRRPRSSELRDALGGHERVSLEMRSETVIGQVWTCTLRTWLSEVGDATGDWDWVNSDMNCKVVIERVWRCTCRLWSSRIGGVLGTRQFGGRRHASCDSIHWLTWNCGNVESWVQQHPPGDGKLARRAKLAGSAKLARCGRLSILGWCCTWCMLYTV